MQQTRLLKAMVDAQLEMFRIYKYYTSNNIAHNETASLGLPTVDEYTQMSYLGIAKIMVDRAKEILLSESKLED
jgi:hypothetical protein